MKIDLTRSFSLWLVRGSSQEGDELLAQGRDFEVLRPVCT